MWSARFRWAGTGRNRCNVGSARQNRRRWASRLWSLDKAGDEAELDPHMSGCPTTNAELTSTHQPRKGSDRMYRRCCCRCSVADRRVAVLICVWVRRSLTRRSHRRGSLPSRARSWFDPSQPTLAVSLSLRGIGRQPPVAPTSRYLECETLSTGIARVRPSKADDRIRGGHGLLYSAVFLEMSQPNSRGPPSAAPSGRCLVYL